MKKTIKKTKPAKRSLTDLSRAERSLGNSELRYRRLFETAQDGILILDAKTGAITDVNPYLIALLGYSREEFIEKKLWQVGAFKDIQASKDAFEALQENEYIRYENLPLKAKGGRLIQVEFVSNVYRVGEDKVIQCNIRDITEHKRLVAAMQENEKKYRALVTSSPDGLFLIDLSGNFLSVNKAICDELGFSEAELRSMNIWDIVPDQYLDQQRTRLTKILNGGSLIEPSEYSVRGKDGKILFIEVMSAPYYSEKGIIGFQGIARDITARKRAEESLRESEERFRAWIQSSSDVVTVVGLDGTIQYESPSIEHLLGYKPEELIGTNAFDLMHPDDRERVMEIFAQNIASPESAASAELRFRHRDGSWRVFESLGKSYLDKRGQMAGLINSRDITERKRAEQEISSLAKFPSENPNPVLRLSRDGIVMYANAASGALLRNCKEISSDFPRSESGQNSEVKILQLLSMWGCAVGGSAPQSWRDLITKALASGENKTVDIECDGKVYSMFVTPVAEEGYVNLYGRDITGRKRAEARIAYQANLLAQVSDAIVASDEQYRLAAWNAAAEAMYGWRAEEVLGRDGIEIVLTEWTNADPQEMRQMIAETGHWRGEATQQRKDGTRFPVEVSSLALRDESGQITGYVSVNRDITERKRAEETRRQRLNELEVVHTVSTALRAAHTRDEALPILLDETLSALETDVGVIWLYHPDRDELRVAVTRGWFRQFEETPIKPGEGITGTVFATGQAQITAEFARDPVARQPIAGQFPAGWGGVCLPIRTGAITVGTLAVSLPPPRQITPEQMKLLESLAEMAGAALHRMNLHEETVRQLDRLEALHKIDIAIGASMDLQLTLNILLKHVKTQLNADATSVLLLNPHSHTLEYTAGCGFRTRSAQTAHIRLGESFAGRVALERRAVQADDPAQIQQSPHFAALWAGEGFAAYYGVPLIAKGEIKGVLEVYHRAPFHPESDWINFLETLAGQTAIAIEGTQLFENLQRSNVNLTLAYDATIEGWSHALDLRDKETEGHSQRVTEITLRLAKAMGIGDAELVHVRHGALLHDIGKMGVPDSILLKPDKLTDAEWVTVRQHPRVAYDMLSPINYLHAALDIPYCHHEKWDGTGYPRGLKGEQIPLVARIFSIVDVWDALTSDRPYRLAWSREKVLEHIRSLSGTHFDPKVVEVFLKILR